MNRQEKGSGRTVGYGPKWSREPETAQERALVADGWRMGNDERWRNDRFGGAYSLLNALVRIGSKRGEVAPPTAGEVEALLNELQWKAELRKVISPGQPEPLVTAVAKLENERKR